MYDIEQRITAFAIGRVEGECAQTIDFVTVDSPNETTPSLHVAVRATTWQGEVIGGRVRHFTFSDNDFLIAVSRDIESRINKLMPSARVQEGVGERVQYYRRPESDFPWQVSVLQLACRLEPPYGLIVQEIIFHSGFERAQEAAQVVQQLLSIMFPEQ